MQAIFLAQNANGACRELKGAPAPEFAGGFWLGERLDINDYPPPGECREYRLAPAEDDDDKNARIAELQSELADERASDWRVLGEYMSRIAKLEIKLKNAKTYGVAMADDNRGLRERIAELEEQLASRSPGVMPECVEQALAAGIFEGHEALSAVARAVKYYAPPDGHEWQPVNDENPITAEDLGRKMCFGETLVTHVYRDGGAYKIDKENRFILRPVAPPFVFAGEPGKYRLDSGEEVDVIFAGVPGLLVMLRTGGEWKYVNHDGTFDGGRITGRVK